MLTDTGPLPAPPIFKPLPYKRPAVDIEYCADGSIVLRSGYPPGKSPRSIAHLLSVRASEHPNRPWMGQRDSRGGGVWRLITYGEAKLASDAVATWLLHQGLNNADSVMVLSGNSIEHALLMLGCYAAGVPIAPISTAYALSSTDHRKLTHCATVVKPRVIFAQSGDRFSHAIATLRAQQPDLKLVTVDGKGENAVPFSELLSSVPSEAVARSIEAIGHETVAKYLFTSGSTGTPKCVPQTHGMFAGVIAGQDGLREEPRDSLDVPQSLEWMPWSHISAGNIGFNGVIWAGGTVYLDEGRPIPGQFETTIKNLYEVSPEVFSSAPVALGMLADAMERDPRLRQSFFKNLRYIGYGGATLSNDIYERLQALAIAETGNRIALTTMYGSTETQGVTVVHWPTEHVGLVGLPMPGITLKLVPNMSKLEVRVYGPTVASGYHLDPERTAAAFDEDGFYRLGDAARFVDPENPVQGLAFDGRLTEDFKLNTGTWVSVGTLRPDLVAACSPYVADALIVGQDKPFVAALLWPTPAGLQAFTNDPVLGTPLERLTVLLRDRLAAFNAAAGGSSRRVARFKLMSEPPSIEAGEITEKGYVNQRVALERRAREAAELYDEPAL